MPEERNFKAGNTLNVLQEEDQQIKDVSGSSSSKRNNKERGKPEKNKRRNNLRNK